MAQGGLKLKTKLSSNIKKHSIHRGVNGKRNKDKRVPKKPKTFGAKQMLQKEVSKAIRMNIEEEMRSKAINDGKCLATNVTNNTSK